MYKAYIFDLYGTLVDIRTNEDKRFFWTKMSELYTSLGARYGARDLKARFLALVVQEKECCQGRDGQEAWHQGKGRPSWTLAQEEDSRDWAGAAGPAAFLAEPDLRKVFGQLYLEKGVPCDGGMARMTALFFRTLSRQYLRVYDGVKETLRELAARGKKRYLLSNAQGDFTRPELEMTGLSECFDGILLSSEEGCRKPSPAFFDRLLKRYGLLAGECLMVGNDEMTDIGGACLAGMDSLYIHTATSPRYQGRYRPTYQVMDGDWGKVAAILCGQDG